MGIREKSIFAWFKTTFLAGIGVFVSLMVTALIGKSEKEEQNETDIDDLLYTVDKLSDRVCALEE